MNFFLSCCNDSELLEKLADEAAFYGNYVILKQIQHKYKDLPLETLLTQAINSESPESVTVVSNEEECDDCHFGHDPGSSE